MSEDCRRAAAQLTSWADQELDGSARAELEAHLERCAGCRRLAVLEQGGRTVLRARADRLRTPPLPPGLQSRCEAAAREASAGRSPRRGQLIPAFLAGALLLFIAVALVALATPHSPRLLAAQLTADHLKCFEVLHGPEMPADDLPRLEAALHQQFGYPVHVPPSSGADGVRLMGASRCLHAGGTVPHLMYRAAGQDMSLYMVNGVAHAPAEVVTLGYRSRIWSSNGVTYILVARDGDPDLAAAATSVMRRAR